MFSVQQKREISDAVQKILRSTMHPELPPTGEITFSLKVLGAESWSYADIKNNGAVGDPGVNPHNELMASLPEGEARGLIEDAQSSVPYMPDPRVHPDEMMQEMLKQQLSNLTQRIYKAEAIIIDYNKRLGKLEGDLDVRAHEVRLTQLENFLTPIMEDNLIQHHDDQLRNIMTALGASADSDRNALLSLPDRIKNIETAMRQLGNPQIQKTLKGD